MAHKPIFPDCRFPDDCQCAPRGYEHEMDSCAVPGVAAAAAMLGAPTEGLFKGQTPKGPPASSARPKPTAVPDGSVMVLPDSGDLIRDLQAAIRAAGGEACVSLNRDTLKAAIDRQQEVRGLRAEAGLGSGPLTVDFYYHDETLKSGARFVVWLFFGQTPVGDAVWWEVCASDPHWHLTCATKGQVDQAMQMLRLAAEGKRD